MHVLNLTLNVFILFLCYSSEHSYGSPVITKQGESSMKILSLNQLFVNVYLCMNVSVSIDLDFMSSFSFYREMQTENPLFLSE